MAGIYIDVDTSDVGRLLRQMRNQLTPEQFDKLMRRTLREAGRIKRPIIRESVKYYDVPSDFVRKGIGTPRIEGGGGNLRCVVPLKGPKGTIGGTFKASGGHYGGNPPAYRIRANIVRGQVSTLPTRLANQGGQPPFRNTGAKGIGNTVMTRKGSGRFPLEHVSGLAMPQMPMNRARPELTADILERLEKRAIHNFNYLFG